MHWDPEFSDVKMIQAFLLTTELDRITRQHSKTPNDMPGAVVIFRQFLKAVLQSIFNSH